MTPREQAELRDRVACKQLGIPELDPLATEEGRQMYERVYAAIDPFSTINRKRHAKRIVRLCLAAKAKPRNGYAKPTLALSERDTDDFAHPSGIGSSRKAPGSSARSLNAIQEKDRGSRHRSDSVAPGAAEGGHLNG